MWVAIPLDVGLVVIGQPPGRIELLVMDGRVAAGEQYVGQAILLMTRHTRRPLGEIFDRLEPLAPQLRPGEGQQMQNVTAAGQRLTDLPVQQEVLRAGVLFLRLSRSDRIAGEISNKKHSLDSMARQVTAHLEPAMVAALSRVLQVVLNRLLEWQDLADLQRDVARSEPDVHSYSVH